MIAIRNLLRVLSIGSMRKQVTLDKSAYVQCTSLHHTWYPRRFTGYATGKGDSGVITGYELFCQISQITQENTANFGKLMPSSFQQSQPSFAVALAEFKALPKNQQIVRVLNACASAIKTDGLDELNLQRTATRFIELTDQLETFFAKVLPADSANVTIGLEKLATAIDLAAAKQALGELRTLFFSVIARVEQLERQVAGLMEAMSTLELRRFIERARFEVVEQLRIEHEELGKRPGRKAAKQDGARRVPVCLSEWLTSGSKAEREDVRRSVYAIVQLKYGLSEREWELLNRTFYSQLSADIHTVGKNTLPPVDVAMQYVDALRSYQDVDECDVPIVKTALRKLIIELAATESTAKPKSG